MISTSRRLVLLHCQPHLQGCVLSDYEEVAQHARERAEVSGYRQRVAYEPMSGLWITVTTDKPIKALTWHFDGRTYEIVDAQS